MSGVIIWGQHNSPRRELSGEIVQRASALDGNCPGGKCPEDSCLGVIVLGRNYSGGNCPGSNCARLELSGGQLSRTKLS